MNYGALQAQIAGYLHRSDLSAEIPEFIEKARCRIGRDLRSLEQEQAGTAAQIGATETYTLPADYQQMRQVVSGGRSLRQVNPHELTYWTSAGGQAGGPSVYAIQGRVMTAPGAGASCSLWYYRIEPALTLNATEHPTMAAHPQIWLAASMMEAALYTADTEQLATWSGLYDQEVQRVNFAAQRARQLAPAGINSDAFSTFAEAAN